MNVALSSTRMRVDPWHNWDAHYEVLPGKEEGRLNWETVGGKSRPHLSRNRYDPRRGSHCMAPAEVLIGGDDATVA